MPEDVEVRELCVTLRATGPVGFSLQELVPDVLMEYARRLEINDYSRNPERMGADRDESFTHTNGVFLRAVAN